jgi:hypothetical protein
LLSRVPSQSGQMLSIDSLHEARTWLQRVESFEIDFWIFGIRPLASG